MRYALEGATLAGRPRVAPSRTERVRDTLGRVACGPGAVAAKLACDVAGDER
jgi:hypothetical protein